MFTIRVAVQVRPEGCDAFAAQLKKEEQEVPATFAGCQRFAAAGPGPHLLLQAALGAPLGLRASARQRPAAASASSGFG